MPLSRQIAHWNKVGFNRVAKPLASRAPGFGVITHHGRTSGTAYRTPVNVFRHADRFTIALTYGADADWVRNVLHAGGCELTTRGHTVQLVNPLVVNDRSRSGVPVMPRAILGLLKVNEFLELDLAAP